MNNLCYDVMLNILEHLNICDIFNVRLVSKQFDDFYNDNLLWKTHFERDYDIEYNMEYFEFNGAV